MSISANFPTTRPSLLLDFADTRLLDPRITFARASTATFYDQTTTALAEQNLLLQSQAFNNGYWGSVATTVSDNTTVAPDGTTTASTITLGVSGANALFNATGISVTALSTYTFSFYALRGTATDMSYAIYNLTGASFITAVSYYSQTNSSTWSRIVVTFTVPAGCTSARVYTSSNSTSTGTFYLWGAQLEQRSTATAYTPTTTAAITNYIPVMQTAASGVARFDCNPSTGESLGLLIEESRTNLLTYSSGFDNAIWTKTRSSITTAADVAPDGTLTAAKLVEDSTATNSHILYQGYTITAGNPYVFSMYLKAAERTKISITFDSVVFAFDIGAGTTASSNATITAVGNSWYRITCLKASIATASSFVFIILADSSGSTVYTGNGYSGIFIWGAQLEAGSFATSYIPTVASQVTRAADSASMTGTNFSSWYNVGQGSSYAEFITYGYSAFNPVFDIGADQNNLLTMALNSTGIPRFTSVASGASQTLLLKTTAIAYNTASKIASTYAPSSFAGVFTPNGNGVVTSSTGLVPAVNQAAIGGSIGVTRSLNGTIKRIAYYPKALTSTQLQALTAS